MSVNPAATLQAGPRRPGSDPEILDLLDLCLNNLEGYSAVLFTADRNNGPLRLKAFRSLSAHIDPEVLIHPGDGLVGWAYKTERPVNVDQVAFESDRLLFYTRDEGIKSFMAIPLPDIAGILAVDSKQRYIFTDKSAKLLMQFGQSISRAWSRLFGRGPKKKGGGPAGPAAGHSVPENEICALWQGLEYGLSRPDHEGGGLTAALELVRRFSGLTWAFVTVLKAGDQKNYHLAAASDNAPENLPAKYPLASGLAGWLHTKVKPLTIDRLKADSRNSFIFQKSEPLEGFRSFYGWPILYNDQLRGSLILAGRDGETLDPALIEVMECVADRLAAQFHLDRLIVKLLEMDVVDSQTGLPHRAHFLESLHHMMEVADVKGEGVDLYVLATAGLGAFASGHGQPVAGELLRAIARQLQEGILPSWRLGHVSYGVFTLATPSADSAEAKKLISRFKKNLEDWPLPQVSGRADLGLFLALAAYPKDATVPEQLLELALTALADSD